MAESAVRECSTPGCTNPAAFTTRSKPAWCLRCIDETLRRGGLKSAEPFPGQKKWWLTTCLGCAVQAHYRFVYVLDKNRIGEKVCRACYWTDGRAGYPSESPLSPEPALLQKLGQYRYEFVSGVGDSTSVFVVKCMDCSKISVERIGDIPWGCTCSRNTRPTHPGSSRAGRVLLFESELPALQWWDYERNDEAALRNVTTRATRECFWKCPVCDQHFSAQVYEMTSRPSCPDCEVKRKKEWEGEYEVWKVTPVVDVPALLSAWADDGDPRSVMVAEGSPLRRFRCEQGHHPRISPLTFLHGGCPHCRGAHTAATSKQWLADTLPEIASQWHPTRNGKLTPHDVVWDSKRTVWWKADCCGHEWQDSVRDRDKYQRLRCPTCRTILGSLAWRDPGLAAEWSPSNPVSPWKVRPHEATNFVPEWVCATEPTHVWTMALSSRSNGSECPECRQHGKSRVELDHHLAATETFGAARSGVLLRNDDFTSRNSWTVDICINIDGLTLVIEYDGACWHASEAKALIDESKTRDLLAAGYAVVRLREDALSPLAIDDPRYKELRVYSTAPRPQAVMDEIRDWANRINPLTYDNV